MNVYECCKYEIGHFENYLEKREFLFAPDADTAKTIFRANNGYRKNARGIEINQIKMVLAHRYRKAKIISHREYSEDYRCAGYTTRTEVVQGCYCSHCKGETSATSQLCTNCGAMFV